ncbi:MAG: nucleotidyltransferase, partial [Acidobacteriota bacterium]|nr:nucleotidyltransferase [Acidobacteriota bacterium]
MADDRSLLDLVALEQELEALLHRPVDVLTT